MKKRIMALVLSFAMVLGVTAAAAGAEKTISVTPMKITVNGQEVTPTKADGTAAEVFAYDGATYVPLRYLSELLGFDVDWDKQEPGTAKLEGDVWLPAASFTPGTYTGTATGRNGELTVEVQFSAEKILSATVTKHQETAGISDPAIERIPQMVVTHQSLGIDAISGATITSNALLEAIASCVKQAGGDAEALKKAPVVLKGEDTVAQADLVVIGAGPAGLLAAAEAAKQGLQVVVLEKQASAGGDAIVSGGVLYGVNSKAHRDRGLVDDTPEDLAKYWKLMEPNANDDLLLKIAKLSGSTIDFISEMGAEFEPELTYQGLDTVPRGLKGRLSEGHYGGYNLIQPIVDTLMVNKNITFYLEARATNILTDETGKVCGVRSTKLADGSTLTVNAPAAIICTGYIDDSEELMKEFHPLFADYTGDGASTGDGQIMAREVGAALQVWDGVFDRAIMPTGALQVNANGERFTNETNFYNVIWSDLEASMGGKMDNLHPYLIIDQKIKDDRTTPICYMSDGIGYTWGDLVDKGFDPNFKFSTTSPGKSFKADTLEELAQQMGVPADKLIASVNRYNELYDLGEDVDFGKDSKYLYKIEEGPFYAWDEYLMVCYFSCGIRTDLDMQVLREDGSVIKGLFAAGWAAAEDFKSNQYPGSGGAICYCITSGRIAGDSAVAYLSK